MNDHARRLDHTNSRRYRFAAGVLYIRRSMQSAPVIKDIVLLGGGHSHSEILRHAADRGCASSTIVGTVAAAPESAEKIRVEVANG